MPSPQALRVQSALHSALATRSSHSSSLSSCRTPSPHSAGAQRPATQRELSQSLERLQGPPTSHSSHSGPPQSMPVSPLLRTPSLQEGGDTQRLARHEPVSQSSSASQRLPRAQGSQPSPPQSTSVSVPLRAPSSQVAGSGLGPVPPSLPQEKASNSSA